MPKKKKNTKNKDVNITINITLTSDEIKKDNNLAKIMVVIAFLTSLISLITAIIKTK